MTFLALRTAAAWVVGAAVLRVVAVPAEVCPPVSVADASRAVREGVAWLERGQAGDGTFLYGFDRSSGGVSQEYNTTRHTGVLLALYAAGRVPAADRGLGYVERSLVRHGGWTAYASEGTAASVGANGLLLAALAERRAQTRDPRHDDLIRGIARFLVAQQQPGGGQLWSFSRRQRRQRPGRRPL